MLGTKTLNFSASFYEEEDAEETKTDKFLDKLFGGKAEKILMGATTVFAVVLAVAIFIVLPYFLSSEISAISILGFSKSNTTKSLLLGFWMIKLLKCVKPRIAVAYTTAIIRSI